MSENRIKQYQFDLCELPKGNSGEGLENEHFFLKGFPNIKNFRDHLYARLYIPHVNKPQFRDNFCHQMRCARIQM